MEKFLENVNELKTPLALAGLFAAILFLIFREIIRKDIFSVFSARATKEIFLKIINYLFILALVAMILGFIGYIIGFFVPNDIKYEPRIFISSPHQDLQFNVVVKQVAKKENVTINLNENCQLLSSSIIESGDYEGKDVKDFFEKIRERIKGSRINYQIVKEGERRYEIICQ